MRFTPAVVESTNADADAEADASRKSPNPKFQTIPKHRASERDHFIGFEV
jgi:hypothetical protein